MDLELRTKGCRNWSSDSSVFSFSFRSFFQASLITGKSLIAASKIPLYQDAQNKQEKKKDILGMVLRLFHTTSLYFWLVLVHVPSITQNCLQNKSTLIFCYHGALGVAREIDMQLVVWIMISLSPLTNHRTVVQ